MLAELMLRGPQTLGELRTRASRMHPFGSLEEVEEVLDDLSAREEPMVVQLPRQPGRKEHRYTHLLAGQPVIDDESAAPPPEAATLQVRGEQQKIE